MGFIFVSRPAMADLSFIYATLIAFFLPGAVWLLVTRPRGLDALETIAEAAGASMALTGLVALYLFLTGLRLSAAGMIGIYLAVFTVGVVVVLLRGMRLKIGGWGLLALSAVLLVVAFRLYQARNLVLPAWVDPVHHVLLVRKILDYGGLPPDWMPYLPVEMFYHYGFHILAAAFTFWSGFQPAQAVLLFGQVVNAMTAVSVYRLGKAAMGDARRAGLAALFTAFAFQMPAYYLSWGRYTLLAGLVVLPLAMAAALEVRRDPTDRSAWARLVLYSAAVCFCHFLAVGLLGLFFLVLLGAEIVRALRRHALRGFTWQPFVIAGVGALIAAPWLARVWSYTSQMFAVVVPDPLDPALASANMWDYVIYLTGPLRSQILLALGGVGLFFALIQGKARLIAIWGLILAFMATPYGPQFAPFRPDHLAIVLFLPASLLLADLLVAVGEAFERLSRRWWKALPVHPAHVALSLALPLTIGLGISGWGAWQTRDIVNPTTILADAADVAALNWIKLNTPPDARFFINATVWTGNMYRGIDGGYWMLPITGRQSVVPPLAYGWGSWDEVMRVLDWSKRTSEVKACNAAFWSLMHDANLNYVYLHQGVGSLQPAALAGCSGLVKVYDQGGVSIYALSP